MSESKGTDLKGHMSTHLPFGTTHSHATAIMKSYPLGMPAPAMPAGLPPREGLMERLDALQAEARAGHEAMLPMWTTLQGKDFKPPPMPNPEDVPPDKVYKRSCKFTYGFQEPGGGFRMYSDTGLGSLIAEQERKALAEDRKAKKLEERQAKIQALIADKEAKLAARREMRESRRTEADMGHAAATRIQSVHRGRRARRRVEAYKEKRDQYAAARIQYSYRLHLDRKDARSELDRRREVRRENVAAVSIQRAGRNKLGRKRAKEELSRRRDARETERAELEAIARDESAAKIQALYRGRKGRERAKDVEKKKRRDTVAKKQERRLQDKVNRELDRAGGGDKGSSAGGDRSSRGGRRGDSSSTARGPVPDKDRIGGPFGLSGGGSESKSKK